MVERLFLSLVCSGLIIHHCFTNYTKGIVQMLHEIMLKYKQGTSTKVNDIYAANLSTIVKLNLYFLERRQLQCMVQDKLRFNWSLYREEISKYLF